MKIGVPLPTGAERRTATREPVAFEIKVTSDADLYTGVTENLSEGGVFVRSAAPPAIGTRVHLRFTIPGGGSEVALDGEVRWHRTGAGDASGYGVRFVSPTEDVLDGIRAFFAGRPSLVHAGS